MGHVDVADWKANFRGNQAEFMDAADVIGDFTSNDWQHVVSDPSKIARLNAVIDNNPQMHWLGGELYRGISVDDALYHEMTISGKIIPQSHLPNTPTSWSSECSTAENFSMPKNSQANNRIVLVNKTSRPRGISIKALSNYKSENEVLIHGNQNLKVLSSRKEGGITYINVLEVRS